MTISSTTNRVSYTGNGVTTAFSFPYKFLVNADLIVYEDGVVQVITTDYTITGAGDDAGGTVTFVVAPANGLEIVIVRDPAITQGLDLVENDSLPAESVEDAFDKLTMIAQRLDDRIDRAFVLNDSDTSGPDLTIPSPVADEVIKWNDTGTALESVAIASIGAVAIPVPVASGGTGAITESAARTALGLEIGADVQAYDADTTKNDVANVFTQSQTLGAGASLVFEGATADDYEGTLSSADVTADRTWTLPDKSGTVAMTSDITAGGITLGTPVASTSGTSIDFTGIPSGTKRIIINFSGVSTNGSSKVIVQLGDSGGFENTGYSGAVTFAETSIAATNHSSGFIVDETANATGVRHGTVTLNLLSSAAFTWACTSAIGRSDAASMCVGGGTKSLSAELTQVRITTAGGADTFDAGSINIQYE